MLKILKGIGIIGIIVGIYFLTKYVITSESSRSSSAANSIENYLQGYSEKKKHPKFQKVLVVVDGVDGIDKTVESILKQNIQVDEIATCNDAKLGQCGQVVNKYKDPWSKGIVQSTWEREFDRGTIALFIKGGRELPHSRYLTNLLDRWTPEKPLRQNGLLLMKSEQFKH